MTYKQTVEQMVNMCKDLEIQTHKGTAHLPVTVLTYNGIQILNIHYKDTEQDTEEAYTKIFYDIMESGINKLLEINQYFNQI